jgi:hypothetical protein
MFGPCSHLAHRVDNPLPHADLCSLLRTLSFTLLVNTIRVMLIGWCDRKAAGSHAGFFVVIPLSWMRDLEPGNHRRILLATVARAGCLRQVGLHVRGSFGGNLRITAGVKN